MKALSGAKAFFTYDSLSIPTNPSRINESDVMTEEQLAADYAGYPDIIAGGLEAYRASTTRAETGPPSLRLLSTTALASEVDRAA